MNNHTIFEIIKKSIWGIGTATADEDIFEEMKKQAIATLPGNCLSSLGLSSELERAWKKYIILQTSYSTQSTYEQTILPINVPYIILKGTSAAQYYPHPIFRTMGDIDIMTRREDFDLACKQLLDNGYHIDKDIYKEVSLSKNGIIIDLHRQFASMNNPNHVKFLDDLIIENINPTHILPDLINGLTLLEHINQHLEGGIGLRQIIDWMMFVDKCLPDEKWPEFLELLNKIDLEKVAIACTKMCEIYLGLAHREWCADANPDLCRQLMDYIISSGNFGNKRNTDSDVIENALSYTYSPKAFIKLLQKQGMTHWRAAQKHRILRPFAWIYQLFRYISKGIRRDKATSKIKAEYAAAKRKTNMFNALGIKTASKGIVKYIDGKYVKE